MNPEPSTQFDADVVIIGGGPVGLLLANLLGARQVRTLVVEQRTATPQGSMAIGITPPSLEILRQLKLDDVFSREGVPVRYAEVHEAGSRLGRLDFGAIDSAYRFFLSIPQRRTIEILLENLEKLECVALCRGLQFLDLQQRSDAVEIRLLSLRGGRERVLRSRFLVGCDGARSSVREAADLRVQQKQYRQRFIMADFPDRSGLGTEARLYFSPEASVESFPLPGGLRRWIVLAVKAESDAAPGDYLVATVRRLARHELAGSSPSFVSTFGAKRMETESYHRGRIVLAGDAAHVMSSIGGQGMNTGFADAEMLAEILTRALLDERTLADGLALYDHVRRHASRVAADRAERGMWLGTARGHLVSRLRRVFIRNILFGPFLKPRLAPHFAMLTIPFCNLTQVPGEWLSRIGSL